VVRACQRGKKQGYEKDAAEIESTNCFHDAPLPGFEVFKNEEVRDRLEKHHADRPFNAIRSFYAPLGKP
jgi:hypothetical protein